MNRGDVYLVNLDPIVGAEANKTRPAVIVSNNSTNRSAAERAHGVVTVVPVTSNVERIYSFQVLLPAGTGGLRAASKAQAEQVRSLDVRRLTRLLGHVESTTIKKLDAALRLHLAL